jgi:hypothetical protein
VEQGFTVAHDPGAGARRLVLTMSVGGNLSGTLAGRAIVFSRNGRPVFTYGGLSVVDASGRHLGAHLAITGKQLRIVVNTSGARFPLRIDPLVQQTVIDGVVQNYPLYATLGYGVSSNGDEVAAVTGTGAVTVFTEPTDGWGSATPSQTTVTATSSEVSGWSGGFPASTYAALSPDGKTLYVEFIAISYSTESTLPPGFIFVYTHSDSGWTLTDTLSAASGYAFAATGGLTVSADGSTIVAGGIGTTNTGGGEGSVTSPWQDLLVFKQVSGSWSGVSAAATETPFLSSSGDWPWQWSVSADGSTIAVETADGYDAEDEDDIVYTNDGSSQISLAISGAVGISSDGSVIAVGEPGADRSGDGFVDVFERPGSEWTTTGAPLSATATLTDSGAATFGQAVAVNSNGSEIYATENPIAAESGLRADFNGNGFDTYSEPGAGWKTTSTPTSTWTPTTYPSTATADWVYGLELSDDDSTLVSLGADCSVASSANGDDCTPGLFIFNSGTTSSGTTSSTSSTATTSSTSTQVTALTTTTSPTTQTETTTQTDTTPEVSCSELSGEISCTTSIGQLVQTNGTLNLPVGCNFAAADGISCTFSSSVYQVSSAACQSGCSITPAEAESAASAAVQSFLSSIGADSLDQSQASVRALAPTRTRAGRDAPARLAAKRKPYRITRLASKRLSVPAGKAHTLSLKLDASGQAQLRRLHKLKLLVLVARTVDGKTTLVLDRNLTFTAAKKKKKKK